MKKIITILFTLLCLISLSACSKNTVEDVQKNNTNVQVNWEDDFIFVDIDSVEDGVDYSTANGTEITMNGDVDYTTPGTYPATISYTNASGNVVEKETYVVVDTADNKETRKEEVAVIVEEKDKQEKIDNYTVVVNGKTLNMWDDSIWSANLDDAEAYATAIWGEGSYVRERGFYGEKVFVHYDFLTCDEIGRLFQLKETGSFSVSSRRGEGMDKVSACT